MNLLTPQRGGGCLYESYAILFKNRLTAQVNILALEKCTHAVTLQYLYCYVPQLVQPTASLHCSPV